jgi:hypothetical protein
MLQAAAAVVLFLALDLLDASCNALAWVAFVGVTFLGTALVAEEGAS